MKNVFEMMEENGSAEKTKAFMEWQKAPYELKKMHARALVNDFMRELGGQCYVAIGGLDSITLAVFIRSLGFDIPMISVSSLEDKSIQKVHRAIGVKSLLPKRKPDGTFWNKRDILKEFGYPVISKEIAAKISLLQNPTEKNATVRHAIITGETGKYGGYQTNSRMKMSQKWLNIFGGADAEGAALGYKSAPFKVSSDCCYYLKEFPCDQYAKESGRWPFMGLMASEGGRREKALKLNGCNYISEHTKRSCPFAVFYRDDILKMALEMNEYYISHKSDFNSDERFQVDCIIPEIYGEIVETDGHLQTTGAQRTGCSMCGFGIHMEGRPHRFDKLRERNEKEWRFYMYDMEWGKVLDYIGVEWETQPQVQIQTRMEF